MSPDREVNHYSYPFCGEAEPNFWRYILSLTDPFSRYTLRENPVFLGKQQKDQAIILWKPKNDFGLPTGLVTTGEFAGFIGESYLGPRLVKSLRVSRTLAPDGASFNQDFALASIEKRLDQGYPLEALRDILINGGELCYPKLIVESLKIIRYPVDGTRVIWNIRQYGTPNNDIPSSSDQNVAFEKEKIQKKILV